MSSPAHIKQLLQRLNEISSEIKEQQLRMIDIDLLQNYTLQLYDALTQARQESLSRLDRKAEVIKKAEPEIMAPVIEDRQEVPVEEKIAPVVNPVQEKEVVSTAPPVQEKESVPVVPPLQEKETVKQHIESPVEQHVLIHKEKPELKPLHNSSLADKLSGQETHDLASKLQGTRIEDLKKAISINKKFEFIKKLFAEDHEAYAKAIHHLNNLTSGSEAIAHVKQLSSSFNWNEEEALPAEFFDLIRRRFA